MSRMIEDYALIGDLHTAALVARDGSIDWLCLPRFDSRACFAALLGEDRHGHWRIAPAEAGGRISRRYRPDTLILETEFVTGSGTVRLIDCMPPRSGDPVVARMIEGVSGTVEMRMTLAARFEYGSAHPGSSAGTACTAWSPGRRCSGCSARCTCGAGAESRWPSSRSAKATGCRSPPSGGHRG